MPFDVLLVYQVLRTMQISIHLTAHCTTSRPSCTNIPGSSETPHNIIYIYTAVGINKYLSE